MRWSKFKNKDSREIYNIISQRVFPALKAMRNGQLPDFAPNGDVILPELDGHPHGFESAFAKYMKDAAFIIPTPQILQKIITGLDDLYEQDIKDLDMQGDLYEYMLDKLSTAGHNGQFRTPKHIREMMVSLMAPTPDDTICEQRCLGLIQFKGSVNCRMKLNTKTK